MKTYGSTKNFLAIEDEHASLDTAAIAIVSAPYEHTVSYGGGAAAGPAAILKASAYVEFYDDEFDNELCFDKGIVTLKPIDFKHRVDREALDMIESQVDALLDMGKFVVTLGGEHTISAAPIAAHLRRYPKMSVLQFDAHSDLRAEYQGSPYSHASVIARVADFMDPTSITQVGIRAQCIEEARFIRERGVNTFYASAIRRGLHGANWQRSVIDTLAKDVYITFDVDYFDPSVMPATGTPEPDGFFYAETLELLRGIVASGRRIIGFDVVELAPMKHLHHPDLTTARLIYKLMNIAMAETKPANAKTSKTQTSKTRTSTTNISKANAAVPAKRRKA